MVDTVDPIQIALVHGVDADVARKALRRGAVLGVVAIILPGIEGWENAMIEASAVMTGKVPSNVPVVGEPARVRRLNRVDLT